MALVTNELFSTASGTARTRTENHRHAPKTFAAGTGTLAPNALVAFNTSTGFWVPWDADGANGSAVAQGVVFPDEIVLDAAGEVIGHVLLEGIVHIDDLYDANPDGSASDADVATEVRANFRTLGIHVQGLTQVR